MQDLGAVREHRRCRFACVQPALVDLVDVRNEIGLDTSRLSDESGQAAEKIVIGKRVQADVILHALL